jgi:pre-mRNA-splicing factor 38B
MADGEVEEEYYENNSYGGGKKGNNLPSWGNVATMNLNPLILTNITSSPYFKVSLAAVKVREITSNLIFLQLFVQDFIALV